MDAQNKHCRRMTFFVIIACVAMSSALVCAAVSRLTGWDYMSFGIIAAIITGICLTLAAIELMEYQFDWREEEGWRLVLERCFLRSGTGRRGIGE